MGVLGNLEPKPVFKYFEDLCNIPHGSGDTKAISDYCVDFAKKAGLQYYQEEINNVIIIKEATEGYETSPAIIIQGHLDMVCQKTSESTIDFMKDGLSLIVDGDFITADGTTLGADNGIAIAMALALLADNTLQHPRIEALFTVDEETGMYGAEALDASVLTGRKLLNMDSEEEGVFTVSCAGGANAVCILPVERTTVSGVLCKVLISGLQGGHSGAEIHKQRGNANVLMGRFLYNLYKEIKPSLLSLEGGQKDNAITREAVAELVVSKADVAAVEAVAAQYARILKDEFKTSDPGVEVAVEKCRDGGFEVLTDSSAKGVVFMMQNFPNGVQAVSVDIPGLVETSLNLGILKLEKNELSCSFAVRSSVKTALTALCDRLVAMTEVVGGHACIDGEYPPWEYVKDSSFRENMVRTYQRMYGKAPKIEAIHAGLECGILSGKIEGLDCVSIGPDMADVHTVDERLSISSVERVWDFLKEALKESK